MKLGDEFNHPIHGRVLLVDRVGRVRGLVREADKGPGFDGHGYPGVKTRTTWHRGRNYAYGAEHIVRVDELTPVKSE